MKNPHTSGEGAHNPEMAGERKEKKASAAFDFPEPSLWNSAIGRRAFLKRTGTATVGTAIALHGFRMEVLASASTTCWYVSRMIKAEMFLNNTTGSPVTINAQGYGSTSLKAHQAAVQDLAFKLNYGPHKNGYADPNPVFTYGQVCGAADLTEVTVTKNPEDSNATVTENNPHVSHPDFPEYAYKETIEYQLPAGYSSIIMDYTYGFCPHLV